MDREKLTLDDRWPFNVGHLTSKINTLGSQIIVKAGGYFTEMTANKGFIVHMESIF